MIEEGSFVKYIWKRTEEMSGHTQERNREGTDLDWPLVKRDGWGVGIKRPACPGCFILKDRVLVRILLSTTEYKEKLCLGLWRQQL